MAAGVRIFVRALPEWDYWGDRGWEYLSALVATPIPVRALSCYGRMAARWEKFPQFQAPQPEPFVNVVIGPGDDCCRFWTASAIANIVVTAPTPDPRPYEINELQRWLTYSTSPAAADVFREFFKLNAPVITPEDFLQVALRGLV